METQGPEWFQRTDPWKHVDQERLQESLELCAGMRLPYDMVWSQNILLSTIPGGIPLYVEVRQGEEITVRDLLKNMHRLNQAVWAWTDQSERQRRRAEEAERQLQDVRNAFAVLRGLVGGVKVEL